MQEKIADNALYGGGIGSVLFGLITYFSPSEWMVLGILVGIVTTIIGCGTGIWFKCQRLKLLKEYLNRKDKNLTDDELNIMMSEDR
ncbi:lysis protein [Yersinia enterocolitica]|nr:lysis protein [Yersinia enterocolitica]ELI7928891.1 lysis protein [Yersinia enterocolitica]ELI7961104.1 lysis protein [Yersinia enterocolitica]ELI8142499.1 lysis protein [Yersinia enterocolitica]ELI8192222.1 lysis protein [Yersinia enterocolitica]